MKDVREMLQQMGEAGSRFKLKKCGFCKESIEIWGHAIRQGEVRPNDAQRECVSRFNDPTNADRAAEIAWGTAVLLRAHRPPIRDGSAVVPGPLRNKVEQQKAEQESDHKDRRLGLSLERAGL
jgi:hypothetical protein